MAYRSDEEYVLVRRSLLDRIENALVEVDDFNHSCTEALLHLKHCEYTLDSNPEDEKLNEAFAVFDLPIIPD